MRKKRPALVMYSYWNFNKLIRLINFPDYFAQSSISAVIWYIGTARDDVANTKHNASQWWALLSRVVSPEISSGKFKEISGNLVQSFRKFLFPENFQKFYRLLQHFCNTKTLFSWLIVLIGIACMVLLRSTLVPRLSVIYPIRENFQKFPPSTKFTENLQPYF